MWYSIRLRLLLMMIFILLLAVSVMALLASQATSRQFSRYVEEDESLRLERFVDVLSNYYDEQFSWQDVDSVIEQMASITGTEVALVDSNGHIIASSSDTIAGQELDTAEMAMVKSRIWVLSEDEMFTLVNEGVLPSDRTYGLVGAVYVKKNPEADPPSFIGSVNRSLLVAVLVTGGGAMMIAFAVSQRILGPVEALTAAARSMTYGNLSRRVSEHSKDEIGELARAFNAMAAGLQHLEDLRRNMVNDIAHELRTPLSNIRGYIEAIQDEVADPTPEIINSIHEEVMMLNHLIDDLQELSLAEAGQLRLMKQPLDLCPLLTRTVDVLKTQVRDKHLDVQLNIASGLPGVHADPERVQQILRNLLNNAVTHVPEYGKIILSARPAGKEVELSVHDTGVGMTPEQLQNIFERFYRADPSRTRATGGAGLGLAIVKQLVEAHGGRVWAESIPGQETTFTFTLPALPAI